MKFSSAFETENKEPGFFLEPIGLNYKDLDFNEEAALYSRLAHKAGRDHIENLSNIENFKLEKNSYGFGTRLSYVPISNETYVNLLTSRSGLEISSQTTFNDSLKNFIYLSSKIEEADRIRISEINAINEKVGEMLDSFIERAVTEQDRNAIEIAFKEKDSNFVHLGFRSLNLLNFYKNAGFTETKGMDINELSVAVSNKLGENAETINMNSNSALDLKDCDMIVGYHVLECCSDPLKFLKRLYAGLTPGTKVHFEVTIEPGTPRVRYAHLFPFEKGDLQNFLSEAGFIPISQSNIPHPGGPEIERVMAISK